jgi:hypothetical protein
MGRCEIQPDEKRQGWNPEAGIQTEEGQRKEMLQKAKSVFIVRVHVTN